jgi:hypothetical protein
MTSQSNLLFRLANIGVLLFLWPAVAGAQTAPSKPKPTGSISGRITIDGKGAAGIPVAVIEGQSVNRRDAAAHVLSDLEGDYQVSGLTPGEYMVWTLTPALVAEPTGAPNNLPYAGAVKSVLLGAGESVTGIDLKLIRGGVITGRVTTADNKPVVEERISLQLLDANGNPRLGAIHSPYDQMFQTDDRGVYRIFDLAPGRYKVSVGYDATIDGMIRGRRYDKTFYLDPADQSKPAIIELSEGDEAKNIDIRVQPAPKTYSVSGHVIDTETGVPIAKAGVRFMPGNKDPNAGGGLSIQADERGEFSWGGFAPARYTVTATSESYGGNYYSDPVSFEVVDKDLTEIEVKSVPGLSISGVITADGLSAKELMTLLPSLTISFSGSSSGNNSVRTAGRAAVAPDGSFLVEGLRPGTVTGWIVTQRPTFINTKINRMERDGVPVSQNIDLKGSISGLHIVIDYGTGIIRGTVKFEGNDAPITDSRMYVNCRRERARDGYGAQVDARGHFVISNLAPGSWELTLQVNSLTPRPPGGVPIQKQIVNVANGSETEATFVVNLAPRQGGP